jgi:hypothetical protein
MKKAPLERRGECGDVGVVIARVGCRTFVDVDVRGGGHRRSKGCQRRGKAGIERKKREKKTPQ